MLQPLTQPNRAALRHYLRYSRSFAFICVKYFLCPAPFRATIRRLGYRNTETHPRPTSRGRPWGRWPKSRNGQRLPGQGAGAPNHCGLGTAGATTAPRMMALIKAPDAAR